MDANLWRPPRGRRCARSADGRCGDAASDPRSRGESPVDCGRGSGGRRQRGRAAACAARVEARCRGCEQQRDGFYGTRYRDPRRGAGAEERRVDRGFERCRSSRSGRTCGCASGRDG